MNEVMIKFDSVDPPYSAGQLIDDFGWTARVARVERHAPGPEDAINHWRVYLVPIAA